MGFGHRVYKNYDPRAAIVKKATRDVLERLGKPDPLLDIAMQLEEVALADDYFVSRKLYPNVDFYTGVIYKAMGFPTQMFTVLFALGRLPGWIAQWREMIEDPATKIGRPRQVYVGPPERAYARSASADPLAPPGAARPHPFGPGRRVVQAGLSRSLYSFLTRADTRTMRGTGHEPAREPVEAADQLGVRRFRHGRRARSSGWWPSSRCSPKATSPASGSSP